jgi:hypothetical protein
MAGLMSLRTDAHRVQLAVNDSIKGDVKGNISPTTGSRGKIRLGIQPLGSADCWCVVPKCFVTRLASERAIVFRCKVVADQREAVSGWFLLLPFPS